MQGADAVINLSVSAVRLSAIIEGCIEVILPDETLLRQVPITDAVVAFLAVGRVLVSRFEQSPWTIVELVGECPVAVPVMLRLVAACPFLPLFVQVKHITLGIFLREAVVAEAVRDADFVATFIQFPSVVDNGLEEVLRQLIAVMTVKNFSLSLGEGWGEAFIFHVAASRVDGASALQIDSQLMLFCIELIAALPDEGAEVAKASAVGKGSDRPHTLRRDWVVAPLCGAVATFSGYSRDPSRPL